MAAITAAAVGAGAGIIGDVMSQQGQASTNAMSTANMLQQEQWQTQMSDTAMQRRVQDLRAAGLNPMLATGTNGAQVGSVSPASLQNPDAAFGQLGGQVTNAMQSAQVASQIQAQKAAAERDQAAADKTTAEAVNTRSVAPYTGASAQATLDNLRQQNDQLHFTALNMERDWDLTNRTLPQLMADPRFASQYQSLQNSIAQTNLTRLQLGIPRLQNDALWQNAHPDISGWMQSGVPEAGISAVGKAADLIGQFTPGSVINKTFNIGGFRSGGGQ